MNPEQKLIINDKVIIKSPSCIRCERIKMPEYAISGKPKYTTNAKNDGVIGKEGIISDVHYAEDDIEKSCPFVRAVVGYDEYGEAVIYGSYYTGWEFEKILNKPTKSRTNFFKRIFKFFTEPLNC